MPASLADPPSTGITPGTPPQNPPKTYPAARTVFGQIKTIATVQVSLRTPQLHSEVATAGKMRKQSSEKDFSVPPMTFQSSGANDMDDGLAAGLGRGLSLAVLWSLIRDKMRNYWVTDRWMVMNQGRG